MVSCPKCDADIDVEEDELDEGDSITCDECGGTVKVLSVDPLELEPESDTDDDDEEDEDFLNDEEEEDGDDDEDEEEEKDDENW
jgi:alpha-aminoadipate/glutamate carrier protein LysW